MPAVAYNLAVPTLAAFLAAARVSAHARPRGRGRPGCARGSRRRPRSRSWARCSSPSPGTSASCAVLAPARSPVDPDRLVVLEPDPRDRPPARRAGADHRVPRPSRTSSPTCTRTRSRCRSRSSCSCSPSPSCAASQRARRLAARTACWRSSSARSGRLNTWDLPTYALVALLVLGSSARRRGGRPSAPGRARPRGASGRPRGAAYLLFLPFHLGYESAFDGVARWRGGRTSLLDYVTVHGLFLFVIVSARRCSSSCAARDLGATARLARLLARRPRRGSRSGGDRRARTPNARLVGVAALAAAAIVAAALALAGAAAPGLIVAVGALLAVTAVRRARRAARRPSAGSPSRSSPSLWR